MSNSTRQQPSGEQPSNEDSGILLSEVCSPGAYVCHWNGDLLRVTEAEMVLPAPELPSDPAGDPLFVTKISDNPYVPASAARMAAANLDLEIRF